MFHFAQILPQVPLRVSLEDGKLRHMKVEQLITKGDGTETGSETRETQVSDSRVKQEIAFTKTKTRSPNQDRKST